MWKVKPSPELLASSCPEVKREFPMPLVRGYGIVTKIPKEEEVRQVTEILQLGLIKGLAEPPLASLAREPGREVWEHEGRCACGKRAYVFSRCVTCIEKEAAEEFAAAAEERENPTEEKEAEEELVAEDLLAIASAPCSSDDLRSCIVHVGLIRKWAAGWFASQRIRRLRRASSRTRSSRGKEVECGAGVHLASFPRGTKGLPVWDHVVCEPGRLRHNGS